MSTPFLLESEMRMPSGAKIRCGIIRARTVFLFVFLVLFCSLASAGQIVAIVHPDNSVTEISVAELKKIFMMNQKNWADGTRINVLLPVWGSDEMGVLVSQIIKCGDEPNLKKYYMTAIFQQKITEIPLSVSDEQDALGRIAADAGGIAVVDESKLLGNTGVKVIRISGL